MKKLIMTSLVSLAVASMLHAKDVVVDQKNKTFIPHSVTLNVGDNLVFKNSDDFAHNAYTDDEANEFDIGMQPPGVVKKVKMKAPGKFDVECAIHPNMLLEVTVK
jgi:plastocyanin